MTRIVGFVAAAKDSTDVTVGALSENGRSVTPIAGLAEFWADPFTRLGDGASEGESLPLAEIRLVPPVLPDARVICVGLNYRAHVAEGSFADKEFPKHPTLFARWTRSLTVGGTPVPVPPDEAGIDWEGEVMAYVGATLVDADPESALAAVLGYSTFNDLTARRAQKLTSQWILGKNADDSGPLGPLVPVAEVGDLRDGLQVRTRVNGETVQQGSTAQMVYPVGETLALISRTLTLRPGDLLATGTPSGVGYARTPPWLLHPGDTVEVEVERLGVLSTPVVAAEHRHRAPASHRHR